MQANLINLTKLTVGNPAFKGSPLIDPKLITEQAKVNDVHLTLYDRHMSQKGFVYKRS